MNPPLNATGNKQAEAVARRLAHEPLAAIYASDLRRALETAQAVARPHGLSVIQRSDLREVNYGEWEGLTEEECRARNPEILRRRGEDPENVAPPGGESYRDLLLRFLPAIEEVAVRSRDEVVALVTHHGNIRVLFCHLMKVPLRQYRSFEICNAAISALVTQGDRLIIQTMNDTCHLNSMVDGKWVGWVKWVR